jgi:hypothetical protein
MQAIQASRIIFRNISPIYIPISLIGNAVAFVVFSRKTFRNKSIGFYSRAVLICDSICAILFIRNIMLRGFLINLSNFHVLICLFMQYTFLSVSCMSAYLLSTISFDRMMSIVFPNRFKFLNGKRFQIGITIFIILSQLIYYIGFPLLIYRLNDIVIPEEETITTFNSLTNLTESTIVISNRTLRFCQVNVNLDRLYLTLDLINASLIPFLLMITFTTIMIIKIYMTRRNSSVKNQKNAASIKKRDLNFAVVSIALSLLFLIFSMPIVVFRVLPGISITFTMVNLVITQHLLHANFGSMFFINFFVNKLFKKELYEMIGIKKRQQNGTTASNLGSTKNSL